MGRCVIVPAAHSHIWAQCCLVQRDEDVTWQRHYDFPFSTGHIRLLQRNISSLFGLMTISLSALATLLGVLTVLQWPAPSAAQQPLPMAKPASVAKNDPSARLHAISRLGEAKFPADFKHFDWVNPSAPKGGRLSLSGVGSFDNFNSFTFKGTQAPGLPLLDATLFAPSLDEPATVYALIAEWATIPADYSSTTFRLRPEARFNDGRPITPEDVVFSFEQQIKASPAVAIYYRDVAKVEKTADREVTFRFAKPGNRDLPYSVSLLTIIPRHHWTAKSHAGASRNLTETTLEPPLSAGPYRIKGFDVGRSITFERIKDWWAKDLAVSIGQYNFDEIHYTMYRDDLPEFEALKSGDVDLTEEHSSKKWATGYDIPAVKNGRLKKIVLEKKTVVNFQGFVFNTRKPRFADPRVRRAFALAFDFETANKSLFYGLYTRINSVFDNSELAHKGVPSGRELEILEKFRDKVPPEVFTTEYKSPVNTAADDLRKNLREASRLLAEAGWKIDNGVLRHEKTGETMTMEFLNFDTQFDRIVLPYKQNLEKLGVRITLRVVDPTQYENRLKVYDFDVISDANQMSHAPGNEQRELWGSTAADKEASRNRAGIKNPAVDQIIEEILYAPSRADQVAATRALDRVLLWNHYFVPQWHIPATWIAYWNKFGRPEKHPSQDPGVIVTWWYDAEAAAKLGAVNANK